ncbi:hypothetical protein KJ885_01875 [Patescibacteria group bacterium]|nr:hypothetical protein [Patescibacteria group bacterium]
MPSQKRARDLKEISVQKLRERANAFFDDLYQTRLLPVAQAGGFSETISSEEKEKMSILRDHTFRVLLIKRLEQEGFEVVETHDRDDTFLEIKWDNVG